MVKKLRIIKKVEVHLELSIKLMNNKSLGFSLIIFTYLTLFYLLKTILMENKVGGLTLPDFKAYYKATIIKTVWCWYKNRYIDQWKRIKSQGVSPYTGYQLIFDKSAKGKG